VPISHQASTDACHPQSRTISGHGWLCGNLYRRFSQERPTALSGFGASILFSSWYSASVLTSI
jgi:hypothetical protein